MQIVTDTGMDLHLPPDQSPEIQIHTVRHSITLDGKMYFSGFDIEPEELQKLLMATSSYPTTSQPSASDFASMYQRLAVADPDILSIHMSSGQAAPSMPRTPEAHVTIIGTKMLCTALGWQVAAAARALKTGWPLDQILALIERIGAPSGSIYTLDDLKYLIHSGRISHMKGLLASLLQLRPLIGMEHERGTYEQLGTARTFDRALQGLIDLMLKYHPRGSACACRYCTLTIHLRWTSCMS